MVQLPLERREGASVQQAGNLASQDNSVALVDEELWDAGLHFLVFWAHTWLCAGDHMRLNPARQAPYSSALLSTGLHFLEEERILAPYESVKVGHDQGGVDMDDTKQLLIC